LRKRYSFTGGPHIRAATPGAISLFGAHIFDFGISCFLLIARGLPIFD
jgi:hypothetical protein